MPPELPQQPKSNNLERQLDALIGIQMNDLKPEVHSYLQNLITQAQGILTSHQDLTTAPIEILQTLQALITKLKHVAKTKEFPLEDDPYKFTVTDAINPYHEVLAANGLQIEHECNIELNLKEILESDREAYNQSNLPEWAESLPNTFTIPPESRKLIEQELKDGAIPIFMPSSQVQRDTLLKALKSLKPTWIKEGATQTVDDPYIWDHIQNLITTKDPTLTDNIPDKPYILLVKPTQKPPEETASKTLEQQKTYLAELQRNNSHLRSMLPQEYGALQVMFTRRMSPPEANQPRAETKQEITTLDPLDKDTFTRFITLPLSSDGGAPVGVWSPDGQWLRFDYTGAGWAHPGAGFRLCVRVEIETGS